MSLSTVEVEGKLDTLADKIYERYANRFFDDERMCRTARKQLTGARCLCRRGRRQVPRADRQDLSASIPHRIHLVPNTLTTFRSTGHVPPSRVRSQLAKRRGAGDG